MVVVGKIEAVLQLGLSILGIGIKADTCIHDLAVVLAGLDVLYPLLEPGKGTERIDDDLSGIRVGAQEQLTFSDVTGVVRNSMGDVSVVQGRDCDDSD